MRRAAYGPRGLRRGRAEALLSEAAAFCIDGPFGDALVGRRRGGAGGAERPREGRRVTLRSEGDLFLPTRGFGRRDEHGFLPERPFASLLRALVRRGSARRERRELAATSGQIFASVLLRASLKKTLTRPSSRGPAAGWTFADPWPSATVVDRLLGRHDGEAMTTATIPAATTPTVAGRK